MRSAAGELRFFLDSADRDVWCDCMRQGWIFGATTNPTILERAGLGSSVDTARRLVDAAGEIGFSELHLQSWGGSDTALAENGRALAALAPFVTVKIPATADGFRAAAKLKAERCRVTLTACYTARQCAAACAIGLSYVAPYYGRMTEAGIDADQRLDAMRAIVGDSGLRILIASVRNADQLDGLLARGFDTFTLAPSLASVMASDPASDTAAEAFEKAAKG